MCLTRGMKEIVLDGSDDGINNGSVARMMNLEARMDGAVEGKYDDQPNNSLQASLIGTMR